jgi:hypothetical protein
MRMWPLQLLADGPNVFSPYEIEILLSNPLWPTDCLYPATCMPSGKTKSLRPMCIARQLNLAEEKTQSCIAWMLHFLEKGSVQERAMLVNRMAGGS